MNYFARLNTAIQYDGENLSSVLQYLSDNSMHDTDFRLNSISVIEIRERGMYGEDAPWYDWNGPNPLNVGDWVAITGGLIPDADMSDPTKFYTISDAP